MIMANQKKETTINGERETINKNKKYKDIVFTVFNKRKNGRDIYL